MQTTPGIYRYKNNVDGAWVDARCGKFVEGDRGLRETMINLAHWLTAQPHAGRNYDVWEELIDEAVSKIGGEARG
jgi:hypothetical protein